MTETALRELARKYVGMWNEPDPAARRAAVRELWAEDGVHLLHPPEDIRKAAAGYGFVGQALEARGYEALELRVARSHEEFVATGEFTFAPAGEPVRLKDVVRLDWQAVRTADGEAAGGGTDFLVLDRDGRIAADYQFPG
ncbi:hypothetical protein AB0I00_12245 [Streptomyces sp. NPDC050803]|uniref:hypothetical protein n=1 Tax=unclassified Streptomyces TaxID=2593676 RepID=UPI003436D520